MASAKLTIFEPLTSYLIASGCLEGSADHCSSTNRDAIIYNRPFYQVQNYKDKPAGSNPTDVPPQFTGAVVKVGLALHAIDKPTRTASLAGYIARVIKESATNASKNAKIDLKDIDTVIPWINQFVQSLKNALEAYKSTGTLSAEVKTLIDSLKNVIPQTFNIVKDRAGNPQIADSIRAYLESVKSTLTNKLNADTSRPYTGTSATIPESLQKIINENKNYTGDDKELFDAFFNITASPSVVAGRINVKTADSDDAYYDTHKRNVGEFRTAQSVPVLTFYLPILDKGTRVWYRTVTNTLKSVVVGDGAEPFILRKLFVDAYNNGVALINGEVVQAADALVGFDSSKYEKSVLCQLSSSAIDTQYDTKFEALGKRLVTPNGWERVGDEFKKRDANGNWITINCDASATAANDCFTTGLYKNDDAKCRSYVKAINEAAGNNVEQLQKFINTSSFNFNENTSALSQLHPVVALKTLKAFGFKTVESFDVVSNQIVTKVCSVETWINKFVASRFNADVVEKIKGNTNMKIYLGVLVYFVNANPSLLNPNLASGTVESTKTTVVPEVLKARGVTGASFGKTSDTKINWEKLWQQTESVFGVNPLYIQQSGSDFYTHGGFPIDMLFPSLPSVMGGVVKGQTGFSIVGGGNEVVIDKSSPVPQFTTQILNEINTLIRDLSVSNKVLDDREKSQIQQKLEQFGRLERELFENSKLLMVYSKLLRILGDNGSKTVSMNTVRGYVDKHNGLLSKHRKYSNRFAGLISVLKSACSDNSDGGDINV